MTVPARSAGVYASRARHNRISAHTLDCSCPGLQAEREIFALEDAGEAVAAAALRRKLERPTLAGKPSWPASLNGTTASTVVPGRLIIAAIVCPTHSIISLRACLSADMSDNFLVLVAELERCFGAERVLPSRSELREMNRCAKGPH